MFRTLSVKEKKLFNEVISFVWPFHFENDCHKENNNNNNNKSVLQCFAVCGTECCCFATNGTETLKINGFGTVIGDSVSAHEIALKLIRFALKEYKSKGKSKVLNRILNSLSLHSVDELIEWTLNEDKSKISAIATLILNENIDDSSLRIIEKSVTKFVESLLFLVTSLCEIDENSEICIALSGSLFDCRIYRDVFTLRLSTYISRAKYCFIERNACGTFETYAFHNHIPVNKKVLITNGGLEEMILPISTRLPVTESRNKLSMNLDTMPVADIVDLMLREENGIHKNISLFKQELLVLIERVAEALNTGGRLFYVGAGTSGRLCVLDASECKHTFNVSSGKIQGVIAGGIEALYRPSEDAEDCIREGIAAMRDRSVKKCDIVIGVTACGKTPFVWGSLYEAKKRHAFTCLLAFNPHLEYRLWPDLVININLGPEVLTGSTRLKCGSATKNILNMISTIAMIKSGKCIGNLMSDVIAVNDKLKERATRVFLNIWNEENAHISAEEAQQLLEANDYNIRLTLAKLMKNSTNGTH